MTAAESGPELALVERYVRLLINLTSQGKFAELAERHYRVKPSRRKDATEMLRRNQGGHLKMLKQVLEKRPQWLWSRSIGNVMVFGIDGGAEYSDDGLFIKVEGDRAIAEPFSNSLILTRNAQKLKPQIRKGAGAAGISPFVFKEVERLHGHFTRKKPTDPISAFSGIDWGPEVEFNTPDADEVNLVAGLQFCPAPPHPPEFVPEGFTRRGGVTLIGNDAHTFYGIALNELDPLDPTVLCLDHTGPAKEPFEDTFLSIWLARLRRRKIPSRPEPRGRKRHKYDKADHLITFHEPSSGGGSTNWLIQVPKNWEVARFEVIDKKMILTLSSGQKYSLPEDKVVEFLGKTNYGSEKYDINSVWEAYKQG